MNKLTLAITFFCFLFFQKAENVFAQCCSAGSPTGGTTNAGSLLKKNFRFIGFYQFGFSKEYLEGDKKVNFNLVTYAGYHFLGLNLAYGITDKFTVELEPGFYFSKNQIYGMLPPPNNEVNGFGLSDFTFQSKYAIIKNSSKQFEITPGVGFKFPLTLKLQEENNVVLTQDVQPSSNAFSFVGSLFVYKGMIEKKMHLFWISKIIIPFHANENKYKFGETFITSLFFSYSLTHKWSLIAQIRYEYRNKDIRNEQSILASGSNMLYFSPQINYTIGQKWNISLLFDIPVYQYYNGVQLSKVMNIALIVNRIFDLNKKNTLITPTPLFE